MRSLETILADREESLKPSRSYRPLEWTLLSENHKGVSIYYVEACDMNRDGSLIRVEFSGVNADILAAEYLMFKQSAKACIGGLNVG